MMIIFASANLHSPQSINRGGAYEGVTARTPIYGVLVMASHLASTSSIL